MRNQHAQGISRRRFVRVFLTWMTIVLVIGAGAVWILNIIKVIQGPWSTLLATAFTILGVLFAFFQWVLPLTPQSAPPGQQVAPPVPLDLNQKYAPSRLGSRLIGWFKQLPIIVWLGLAFVAFVLINPTMRESTVNFLGSSLSNNLSAHPNIVIMVDLGAAFLLIFGLLRTQKLHKESVKIAQELQNEAVNILRSQIKDRLLRDETWLLTAMSIKTLAHNIQLKTKSPVINDALIAEQIRFLALEVEKNYRGQEQKQRLETLNAILGDLEHPEQWPLLMVAKIDPLAAYKAGWPGKSLLILLAIISLVQLFLNWEIMKFVFWIIFFLGLVLILSTIRASNYWKSSRIEEHQRHSFLTSLLSPKELNPVFDFLAFIAITPVRYFGLWSIWWAIGWEQPYFSPTKLREFMKMHEYRYLAAQPLMVRLMEIHNNLLRLQQRGQQLPEASLDEYLSLCGELWVITGKEEYKTLMQKAGEGILWEVNLTKKGITPLKNQMARFKKLQRDFFLLKLGTGSMQVSDIEEYRSLCRQLAEITGSEHFRDYEKEAQEAIERLNG